MIGSVINDAEVWNENHGATLDLLHQMNVVAVKSRAKRRRKNIPVLLGVPHQQSAADQDVAMSKRIEKRNEEEVEAEVEVEATIERKDLLRPHRRRLKFHHPVLGIQPK